MRYLALLTTLICVSATAQHLKLKLTSGSTIEGSVSRMYTNHILLNVSQQYRLVQRSSVDSISLISTYGGHYSRSAETYWQNAAPTKKYLSGNFHLQQAGTLFITSALVGLGGAAATTLIIATSGANARVPAIALGGAASLTSLILFISAGSNLKTAGMLMEAESLPLL